MNLLQSLISFLNPNQNIKKEQKVPTTNVSDEHFDQTKSAKQDKNVKNEVITVSSKKFFNEFRSAIPREIFREYLRRPLNAKDEFKIEKDLYNKILAEKTRRDEEEYLIKKVAQHNNTGIDFEQNGDIDSAIKSYEKVITLAQPATHAYDRLLILYKNRNDQLNQIRILKSAIEVFEEENRKRLDSAIKKNRPLKVKIEEGYRRNRKVRDINGMVCFNPYEVKKYHDRLQRLQGKKEKPSILLPRERIEVKIETKPLGDTYEETKKQFKEFDFYNSGEDRTNSFNEYSEGKKRIWKIRDQFKNWILDGKELESEGRLDKACEIYERIVAEKYYLTSPYDRLIKIYSRAKLVDQEKRVLRHAIDHFKELRNNQKEYILSLGSKYNKLSFVEQRLKNNKKISYYHGAFELYNPYTIIEKWEARLNKMKLAK